MRTVLAATVLLAAGSPVLSQNFDPPPAKTPDAATLRQIVERTDALKVAVAAATKELPEVHRADLVVYVKAAEWIVRHLEWFTADSGKQTLAVIEQGLQRAESANGGKTPWLVPDGKAVARGFRSRIDDSVQPYGVIYPPGYGQDLKKKWRLDVHLHGRDSSLTEVKHLNQHSGKPAAKDQDYVQLNIYGRGNNAYRWAGESDVFEAMEHFLKAEAAAGRKDAIDLRRVVLKGFSMGGAGTWHIGLRHPDKFAVLQPGAGFTTTHGYIAKLSDLLPEYQEKCLTIYDAFRYAENAFNVPVVAFSGEIDKQRQAAENIQAELKKLSLSDQMMHLIGPGLDHKFPPEWQKKADAEVRKRGGDAGRNSADRVRFTTYTLKANRCEWATINALGHHYERASIDASRTPNQIAVRTTNVTAVDLGPFPADERPKTLTIDDQRLNLVDRTDKIVALTQVDGKWAFSRDRAEALGKRPGIQGPIDDAFTGRFLCVVGTGKATHSEPDRAARAQLERFRREWDKYMRGTLPVKEDTEVSAEDKRECHLILFGDPESNRLIRELLPALPVRWTADAIELGGVKYDAATHLPMLISPSPTGPRQYIVLNSGHTIHEADFKGTNALLYPRLGDYAIVKPTPTDKDPAAFEVVTAGLFDEKWQVPKK